MVSVTNDLRDQKYQAILKKAASEELIKTEISKLQSITNYSWDSKSFNFKILF